MAFGIIDPKKYLRTPPFIPSGSVIPPMPRPIQENPEPEPSPQMEQPMPEPPAQSIGQIPPPPPSFRQQTPEMDRLNDLSRQAPPPPQERKGVLGTVGNVAASFFLGNRADNILHPVYAQQRKRWESEMQNQQIPAQMEAERLERERKMALTEKQMASEDAQAAASKATEALRLKQAANPGNGDLVEIDRDTAMRYGIMPSPDGKYRIPSGAVGQHIAANAKANDAVDLPPGLANSLGLPEGMKVPKSEIDNYVRILETKANAEANRELRKVMFDQAQALRKTLADATRANNMGAPVVTTDDYGRIQGAWYPKTGEVVQPPQEVAGLRKSPVSPAAMDKRATLQQMIDDTGTLRTIADKHKDNIGWVSGNWTKLTRGKFGANPEVQDMFRISKNIGDQLLRARSGAQINEQEYQRMIQLVPDPASHYSQFDSNLRAFQRELQNLMTRGTGKASVSGAEAPTPQPTGPVMMIAPNGKEFPVKADRVKDAEARGYRRK